MTRDQALQKCAAQLDDIVADHLARYEHDPDVWWVMADRLVDWRDATLRMIAADLDAFLAGHLGATLH